MDFRILGPLEVVDGDAVLSLGGGKQRALLAVLLLSANDVLSADRLIEDLWGERAPASGRAALQVRISQLRKALGPAGAQLLTRPPGYVLQIDPERLDAHRFERLLDAADGAPPERAAATLREALALWRGPALADLAYESFAQPAARRLEELRLAAVENRVEAESALGRHSDLVGELETLVAKHPSRERLQGQLMLALYRCGRQVDALEVYQRTRRHLALELGLEPGPALRTLQQDILGHAPSLRAPSTGLSAPRGPGGPDGAMTVEDRGLPRAEALIGREREVEELCVLLADEKVVLLTLAGTGGAGKTALAVHVAREVGPSFQDGVNVVWLANISDSRQVLPELARRLGVELTSQEPPLQTLAGVLRFQRRLLLLDNFEHVLDAAPAIAELLGECEHLKVLVTSRASLHVAFERVYSVHGLEVPAADAEPAIDALEESPATALFIDRARAADPDFELTTNVCESVAELCRYLAGLPLALELAAARTRVLTPDQILDRLRTLAAPFGPGRRDAPERHRTLQATIDWSLNLLTPDQQRLFAVLGLFVGGFTVDALQAVCGDAVSDVLDALAALLDHSLVQRTPARRGPRLAMLEPIREYALRHLRADASLHRSALVRHAQYYAAFAECATDGLHSDRQLEHLDEFDDELGNLRAVLTRANSQPGLDLALRVTCALGRFWILRDLVSEIRAWLKWALNQPPGDPIIRTRALVTLGYLAGAGWDLDEARTTLAGSLPTCYELGDAALTARSEATLAWSLFEQGDNESAADHAERALNLAARTRDPWTEANVLAQLGVATDSVDIAYRRLQLAVTLYSSLGDRLLSSSVKANLAWYAVVAGDYGYARTLSEHAAVESQGICGASQKASFESHLGLADLFEGRYGHARQHLSQALALSRSIGWFGAKEYLAALAAVAAIEGRDKDAAMLAAAAHAVRDEG